MSIQNPSVIILNLLLVHDTNLLNLFFSILQLFAVWHAADFGKDKKKLNYLLIPLSLAGLAICQFIPLTSQLMLSTLYRVIMLVFIAADSLLETIRTKSINLFYTVIIFNEVVILLKLVLIVSGWNASVFHLLISNLFAVFTGLFFWYYRYDQPALKIDLKKFI